MCVATNGAPNSRYNTSYKSDKQRKTNAASFQQCFSRSCCDLEHLCVLFTNFTLVKGWATLQYVLCQHVYIHSFITNDVIKKKNVRTFPFCLNDNTELFNKREKCAALTFPLWFSVWHQQVGLLSVPGKIAMFICILGNFSNMIYWYVLRTEVRQRIKILLPRPSAYTRKNIYWTLHTGSALGLTGFVCQ